jgi:hypothetical protein
MYQPSVYMLLWVRISAEETEYYLYVRNEEQQNSLIYLNFLFSSFYTMSASLTFRFPGVHVTVY